MQAGVTKGIFPAARPVPVIESPWQPGNAEALYSDTTNVTRTLGWTPRLSDIDTIAGTAWAFHRRAWAIGC